MRKIISIIICIFLLIPTFSSCSRKPELSEVLPRLEELIKSAEEINMIFFGEGLPTYKHISDPMKDLIHHVETTTDEDGNEVKVEYYYYVVPDDTYEKVIAFRKRDDISAKYTYAKVVREAEGGGVVLYKNEERSVYAYLLEGYKEPDYEFFYDESDPEDYDYVKEDCEYQLVSQIKAAAEKVYSTDYLNGIYTTMFTSSSTSARYMNYTDSDGNVRLAKSNKYNQFITETRQFDLSTAKMVRPSKSDYVNIEVESYMPSAPENRVTVRISMILQNGVWMLDSPTY